MKLAHMKLTRMSWWKYDIEKELFTVPLCIAKKLSLETTTFSRKSYMKRVSPIYIPALELFIQENSLFVLEEDSFCYPIKTEKGLKWLSTSIAYHEKSEEGKAVIVGFVQIVNYERKSSNSFWVESYMKSLLVQLKELPFILKQKNSPSLIKKLLEDVLRSDLDVFKASESFIYIFDASKQKLNNVSFVSHTQNIRTRFALENFMIDFFEEIYAFLQKGRALTSFFLDKQKDFDQKFKLFLEKHQIQSFVMLPLFSNNEMIGYWGICAFDKDGAFTSLQLRTFKSSLTFITTLVESYSLSLEKVSSIKQVDNLEKCLSYISTYAKLGYVTINLMNYEYYASKQWYLNLSLSAELNLNKGISFHPTLHEDDAYKIKHVFEEMRKGKLSSYEFTARVKRSDNNWGYVKAFYVVSDYRPDQGIVEIISINLDVSKSVEEQKTRDSANEHNRLKTAFLANMSHEIRTPLNAIVGFSQLLSTIEDEKEKNDAVSIIMKNNELLLEIITDILNLSRIETNSLEAIYTTINLKNLFKNMVDSYKLKELETGVHVVLDRLPKDEVTFVVDKRMLEEILRNLINNAFKFTNKGQINIGYIRVPDSPKIEFYVRDTGCGMDSESCNKVFDRFVKVNNFSQGAGLGLSLCSDLVTLLNGTIGVQSKVGVGSRFWFRLPIKPVR